MITVKVDYTEGFFVRGIAHGGKARVLLVEAKAAANESRRRHELSRGASRVSAQGIVAALLMSAHIKGEERITMQVQAEKPRFALIVDVHSDGAIRARLTPPKIFMQDNGTIDGVMLVIKHDAGKELYRGASPIEKASFETALEDYLTRSQQTTGFVRIESPIDSEGQVERATGLLVERLPGTSDEEFEALFGALRAESLSTVLETARAGTIAGGPLEVLGLRQVEFRCGCSPARAESLLSGLGPEEIASLIEDPGFAEMTCNFCGQVYMLDREQLMALRDAGLAPSIEDAK